MAQESFVKLFSMFASENMVSGNYGCARVQRSESRVGLQTGGIGTELGVELRSQEGPGVGRGKAGFIGSKEAP